MTQAEANIIIAAARVAQAMEKHGYDPFDARMAVAELCDAVKNNATPPACTCGYACPVCVEKMKDKIDPTPAAPIPPKPHPICSSCDGAGCDWCLEEDEPSHATA